MGCSKQSSPVVTGNLEAGPSQTCTWALTARAARQASYPLRSQTSCHPCPQGCVPLHSAKASLYLHSCPPGSVALQLTPEGSHCWARRVLVRQALQLAQMPVSWTGESLLPRWSGRPCRSPRRCQTRRRRRCLMSRRRRRLKRHCCQQTTLMWRWRMLRTCLPPSSLRTHMDRAGDAGAASHCTATVCTIPEIRSCKTESYQQSKQR